MRSEAVAATPSAAAAASRTARGNDAQVTLPVPSGLGDRPRPSGSSANLRVLPWAGFASAVTYSLDDTQPSQIDHWPELKNTGIRMTFYANPSGNWYAGFDTTWQDAIRAGHEIGNHTQNHCHVDLADCKNNLGSVEQEIEQCSSYIKTRLGQADVWTFAFPFGDAGYEAYAKTRFFLARGVQTGTVGPKDLTDPFNLPIIGASGGEAASVFNGHIDTARAQGRWLIFLFHTVLPNSANWYAGVDIASITGSIQYAQALGNVWLDSMVNVGAYWLGQRSFDAATPVSANGKTSWSWTLPAFFPKGRSLRVVVDGGVLSQGGRALSWDGHGYYEVALDEGTLTWSP
jgi:peptidoglycan/xylan/chitin deacetylase (PgdA/CDA1 family)